MSKKEDNEVTKVEATDEKISEKSLPEKKDSEVADGDTIEHEDSKKKKKKGAKEDSKDKGNIIFIT